MFENIPSFLKNLNNWCCYDSRDKPNYKSLSDREINKYLNEKYVTTPTNTGNNK